MMMREERAKQFAPFDAMKGLQEALRDREERHSRVERHEISDEQMERNSEVFSMLTKGCKIQMECYRSFHDITVAGTVSLIDTVFRYLKIGTDKYLFSDIYSIRIIDSPRSVCL